MSDNDVVKRLIWTGLVSSLGAAAGVVTSRVAAMIWRKLYDEDPPD